MQMMKFLYYMTYFALNKSARDVQFMFNVPNND